MKDYPAKKQKQYPKLCEECFENFADTPSKLCPGCSEKQK